ncbi:hypothetical protein ACFL50_01460 [Candidatus Latescibacterota bacterium]
MTGTMVLLLIGKTKVILENSLGHDDGIILYNFNDKHSAWPFYGDGPDMGAIETWEGIKTVKFINHNILIKRTCDILLLRV